MLELAIEPAHGARAQLQAHLQVLAHHTQLQVLEQRAPLKIIRPFRLPDNSLQVVVMDASPGILGGDNYQFDWHFAADARATITTQGFTRVHPSRGQKSQQNTTVAVDNNAICKYLPQPTILFCGADFTSETQIRLAPEAHLFWAETLCAGRIARGEIWQFERAISGVSVWREDKILWCNRSRIEPEKRAASNCGAWENFTHHSLFCAFSPTLHANEAKLEAAREIIENHNLHGGTSATDGGLIGVLFGTRGENLHACLQVLADVLIA